MENLLFSSCSGTQNLKKRAVSFLSGSQEGEDGSARDTVSTLPSPSPFSSGQQGPVRGRDASSRAPCPAVEPGKCHTAHSDPTLGRTAFRVGSLCSTSLPQVQGHLVHLCVEQRCSCLACRDCGPAGEGRDTAGPSSRDEVRVLQPLLHRTQERRWVTTNLGPARSEPDPSQAPVQDVDAETHLSVHPSFRLVRSDRPEGCVLSCLDPPSTQTVSSLCVRRASISVQGPPLRAVPVASCLHQGRGGSPCSIKGKWNTGPGSYWPSLECSCANTGTRCFSHLSRLGLRVNWEKSKLSPVQRISFLGMELDSVNLTARLSIEHAQSMLNCLESFQRKKAVPMKQFQKLLGHMAFAATVTPLGLLHMRPLQRWLHDRVPRWAWRCSTYPGLSHPVLPSDLQPVVRSCFSSGRSSPSASVQACCCINGCPARIHAQSSHHAFQGSGGELASAAPGEGRPSHCSALSRLCLARLRGPHAELQDLRPALCLLRRTAEGKGCLQTETCPLDSGGYSLGIPGPALTVPPQCKSTLYERCGIFLGIGAGSLDSRHL